MYSFYKITLIGTLIAASSVLMTTVITAEPRSTPKAGDNGSIVLPTSSKGILSQCGDYFTFAPDQSRFGVVPEEYDKDFIPVPPMSVPVYGYMADTAFNVDEAMKRKQGDNPYTTAEVNRALWDGHTFIWTSKDIAPESYDYVKKYAEEWNKTHEKKIIALTWKGEKTSDGHEKMIPQRREFAFSSWNISQSCRSFSDAAFEEFLEHAAEHNLGRETTPIPVAKLQNGELPR